MKIAVVSVEGTGLSWARRMHDEGAEVLMYVMPGKYGKDTMGITRVGDGLVPKTSNFSELLAWAKGGIAFFDSSRAGVVADRFVQAGVPVVGAGRFCDKLEEDRVFGEKVARSLGCALPPTKEFSTISETLAFAKTTDEGWHFKSDSYKESDATQGTKNGEQLVAYLEYVRSAFGDRIPNILQKTIPGVALSTACWWNGRAFVGPYEGTIEHKKFANADKGPSTGCSINAVWFYAEDEPEITKQLGWKNLAEVLRKNNCPPCLIDINALIGEKDGRAYFLEFTPRCGWDSEATSHRLFQGDMAAILEGLAYGRLAEMPVSTKDIAYAFRLSIPPYPWEHDDEGKRSSKGVPILGIDGLWDKHFIAYNVRARDGGGIECADRTGLIGCSLATGRSLKKAHDEALTYVEDELWAPGLAYRTDGGETIAKDAAALEKLGFPCHKALLR